MLEKLIADVDKALEADCYFAALALALTLPDICGKAQYPQKKPGPRYIEWYNEHVGETEISPFNEPPMPYLSGEVVYSLRNCLLHQGTPKIEVEKIKEDINKIDQFALVIESKNSFDIYSDAAGIRDGTIKSYRVNVRRLCLILCLCARGYYKANKEKFDFFRCTIIDWCEEVKKMHTLMYGRDKTGSDSDEIEEALNLDSTDNL